MNTTDTPTTAFVRTRSEVNFDLLNPTPDMICIEDIAWHLTNTTRYNGACSFPYSVAQHSLYVCNVLPKELQLSGLLHDATETYIGDVVSPLKKLLPTYKEIENRIAQAICEKFQIECPRPEEVEHADKAVMASEYQQILGWTDLLDKPDAPKPVDALCIEKMGFDAVYDAFVAKFFELTLGNTITLFYEDGTIWYKGSTRAAWTMLRSLFGLSVCYQIMRTRQEAVFRVSAFGLSG